jgi:hypothetical protein
MPLNPSAPRPLADLVEALRRHVRLLRLYAAHAFDDGDADYLGEVAAKLRLLVVKKWNNEPLLIRLMHDCQIEAEPAWLALDEAYLPPPAEVAERYQVGAPVSLADELDLPALRITSVTGDETLTLTKRKLVEVVAEKHGAAHEDWEHPGYLTLLREHELRIKGYPPLEAALQLVTTTVLRVADHVLPRLTPEVVADAERRRESSRE